MQTDGHHLWSACLALFVQYVEGVTDMLVPAAGTAEAWPCCQELEVIAVIAVRNYQTALWILALALLSG